VARQVKPRLLAMAVNPFRKNMRYLRVGIRLSRECPPAREPGENTPGRLMPGAGSSDS